MGFELRWRLAGLAQRHARTIFEALRRVGLLGALEPLADGFFGDAESVGGGAERATVGAMVMNQFSSHEWGECGISVHSDPEG